MLIYVRVCIETDKNNSTYTAPNLLLCTEICQFSSTVKPVYNGHPWDPKIEAVVDRWPLFRGSVYYKKLKLGLLNGGLCIQVAVIQRWPLAQV